MVGPGPIGDRTVLRSRFARRVLLLFFVSALIPVLLVGFISFRSVVSNLRKQEHRRIHHQAKSIAMGVVERLLLLEAELELVAVSGRPAAGAPASLAPVLGEQLTEHFEQVAIGSFQGRTLARLLGDPADLDPVSPAEREHLEARRTVLRVQVSPGETMASVTLGRLTTSGPGVHGIVWGRINREFLWGVGSSNPLPPLTELAVIDAEGRALLRSTEVDDTVFDTLEQAMAESTDRRFEWQNKGRSYLAGYWSIPMRTNYGAPVWTIVVSEERRVAMSAIDEFQRTFPLVLLLSIWIVLLLSLIQIRRSLGPLLQLRQMANRIAERDFDQRVTIASGDEFEELGDALNWMAGRLGEQFRSLSARAAIGRSVLGGAPNRAIAQAALEHVRDATRCSICSLAVARDAGTSQGRSYTLASHSSPSGEVAEIDVDLAALGEIVRLRRGEVLRLQGRADVALALEPLLGRHRRTDLEVAALIPLIAEDTLVGVLAVAGQDAGTLADERMAFLDNLVDQLALALHGTRLRRELDAERQRLTRLVEHLPDGVVVVDGNRRILLANRVGRRVLGVLAHAAVGDRIDRIGGRPLESLLPALPGPRQEITIDEPERRTFTVATGLLGGSPESHSMVIVVREITREREVEEQMHRQERLAAVGRLAAGIAHDFNNLLQGVVMAGEILAMHASLPEPLHRMAREISVEGHRGAQLIRQILDFSRSSTAQREPVDLTEVLDSTIRMLRRTIPESITISVDVEPGKHIIDANASQIQQVLTNLALNARDAMPDGGSLRFRMTAVEVSLDQTSPIPDLSPGRWIRVDVSDSGHGIPAKARAHLFEPFFTTKPAGRGTGLGLAQAYGIVSDHGGLIRFRSAEGQGTTFTLLLPWHSGVVRTPSADAPPVRLGYGERLLVVEDNASVLRVIRKGLEEAQFKVVTARNGRAALEEWQRQPDGFDLVLTDIVMPEMDGIELCRRLRASDPDLPVVLMSGYPLGHHDDAIESLGVQAFLPKPFTLDGLRRVIVHALDGTHVQSPPRSPGELSR